MKARPAKAPPVPAHPGVTVLEDEVVWGGRFPLQRVRFRYTRFDGAESPVLTWELWRRGRSVAVLPYDPWSDRLCLMLRQAVVIGMMGQSIQPQLPHHTDDQVGY